MQRQRGNLKEKKSNENCLKIVNGFYRAWVLSHITHKCIFTFVYRIQCIAIFSSSNSIHIHYCFISINAYYSWLSIFMLSLFCRKIKYQNYRWICSDDKKSYANMKMDLIFHSRIKHVGFWGIKYELHGNEERESSKLNSFAYSTFRHFIRCDIGWRFQCFRAFFFEDFPNIKCGIRRLYACNSNTFHFIAARWRSEHMY